jgi:type I restriction enzyme S subunit
VSFPRYPKYKDSAVEWLGKVPEHWDVQRLKHVAARIPYAIVDGPFGTQLKAEDYRSSGVPLVRISNLSFTGRFLEDDLVFIEDSKAEEVSRSTVRRGDVVIGKTGATIGKSALFDYSDKGVIASSCLKISPDPDAVSPAFLARIIESDGFQKTLLNESGGSTRDTINITPFGNLAAVFPPLAEQLPICRFLVRETAKIDALIAEQQRLIELLQEKRQAVISHAVTKGLNPDAPMKDSGIEWLGQVPKHWEVCRVKTVSSFTTSGPRGWSERVGEDGSLFVQSGDLTDSMEVDFANCKRVQVVEDAEVEAARTRLQDGDVVVCVTGAKTGNVAVCTSVPEASYVNQHVCLIRPTASVLPLFLGMVLKSGYGETYFSLAQYGLKQGLSLEDVREARVILPPLEEQRTITQTLVDLATRSRSLVAEAERAIALLQERRSALISAAVTGQIDVRGLAGSEAA